MSYHRGPCQTGTSGARIRWPAFVPDATPTNPKRALPAGFNPSGRVVIDKDVTALDRSSVEFAHGAGVGAHGVDMRSRLQPCASKEWRRAIGGGADDVGLGNGLFNVACCVNLYAKLALHALTESAIFFPGAGHDIGATDGADGTHGSQLAGT